jgi:nucleoside-diphosphate-sugar epimerase
MAPVFVTGGSGYVGRNLIRALVARGDDVKALARSAASRAAVAKLGAVPVAGDLDDVAAMTEAMRGAELVFHAAAQTNQRGTREDFYRGTVAGTEHVLAAAKAAGVKRLVHVGTEAVLADGKPIVRADETRPRTTRPAGLYPWSKGLAEERVLAASGGGLETVVIRPRFVWGGDDTSVLPEMIAAVKAGRFGWIGGGRYLTSTCHIDNLVEGALLAAEKGRPGEIYFLTDGEPTELRGFVTAMLKTQGVDAGTRAVPRWVARLGAFLTGWRKQPLITKAEIGLFGVEVTVDDSKARRELGYRGAMTIERGLAAMTAAGPIAAA